VQRVNLGVWVWVCGTRVFCVIRVLSRLDELGTETYSVPAMRGNRVGLEVNLLSACDSFLGVGVLLSRFDGRL
jgi:hypothetical protein